MKKEQSVDPQFDRRTFIKGSLGVAVTYGLFKGDKLPKYPYEQDTLPAYDPHEKIPTREVLVTNDDIHKAFDGLKRFTPDGRYFTDDPSAFLKIPTLLQIATCAWAAQHVASAITRYQTTYKKVPDGLPQAHTISGQYWQDGANPGYTVRPKNPKRYTDDGLWLAITDTQEATQPHNASQKEAILTRPKKMYTVAHQNWDNNQNGTYWSVQPDDEGNRYKALVSNAPVVTLAMQLYREESDPQKKAEYLTHAIKVYKWVRENLLEQETNLYCDGLETIGDECRINTDKVSYGQGTMIEAGVQLAEITGDLQYQKDAEKTALEMLTRADIYTKPTPYYDVIYLKSLMSLYDACEKTKNRAMQELIRDRVVLYANNIVRNTDYWNRTSGYYTGIIKSSNETSCQGQAAVAEILLMSQEIANSENICRPIRV